MKTFFKKVFSIFLRFGTSIILLIFLFKQVDEKAMLGIIKNVDIPLLLLAFTAFSFIYLLCFLRWWLLLKAIKIGLPIKRIIISFCGGIFFNLFLPSTIGGDMVRSIDLGVHTKRPREVVTTVLLDRLSGYVGLVIVAIVALLLGWKFVQDDRYVLLSIFALVAVVIAILLVLFNKALYSKINKFLDAPSAGKIREAIKNLHHEIYLFKKHKQILISSLAMSFLVQIVCPLSFYFIALSLGVKIELLYFFIFIPVIGAITMLPISIGGLGLRDASIIFFFAKAGVCKNLAFAMSLLSFLFILIFGASGGLIYVFTIRHRRIQHHQPPAIPPQA